MKRMNRKIEKHRILILGASGFIGNNLYRELSSYFETYGTYCSQQGAFAENKAFTKFCAAEDSLFLILNSIKPTIIISSISGDYEDLVQVHTEIVQYINLNSTCRIIFCSSAVVFDGKSNFPSYENDKTVSETSYGKYKIAVEKLLLENVPDQLIIARIPIVLGFNSPRILHLRQAIKYQATFEVHPNLIITVTTANKLAQQIHYLINKLKTGVFHLASSDMVHHEELFREITEKISDKNPIFKSVFESNNDRYMAIIPKENLLPDAYTITVAQVIAESTFNEEISTLKKM